MPQQPRLNCAPTNSPNSSCWRLASQWQRIRLKSLEPSPFFAASRGIAAQCEMGGQNPSIVLADADIDRTAAVLAAAAMGYAGQKCTATSRIIVVGDPALLTDALVAEIERLPVGDPAEPTTQIGPLINESARTRVRQAATSALARGGRCLTGGEIDSAGWFHRPELFDLLEPSDPAAQDEVFGSFAVVLPTRSVAREFYTTTRTVTFTPEIS
jgi:acyl-CoA reductase-like NAD-dependent aldehyde dehydrogenase